MRIIRSRRLREAVAQERLRRLDGGLGLDEAWIRESGASLIAQITGGRIDADQAERFAQACQRAGVKQLIGMTNIDGQAGSRPDPLLRLPSYARDLEEFDRSSVGGSALLFDLDSSVTWLGTDNDFAIFAGPSNLLLGYEPLPQRALHQFRGFATAHRDQLGPSVTRALELFERYLPQVG